MLRAIGLALALLISGCGGMKPIQVATPNSNPLIISGQLIHDRLVSAQTEIRAARDKKKKKAAQKSLAATETVWERYNANPTVENWNLVQTVGSTLDVALRQLRTTK